jgi:hypothetical protein
LGDRVAELRQIGESSREVAGARDHLREGLELSLHPIHEFGNLDIIRKRSWTNTVLVQRLLVFLIEEFQLFQNFRSVPLRGCILLRQRFFKIMDFTIFRAQGLSETSLVSAKIFSNLRSPLVFLLKILDYTETIFVGFLNLF